MLNHFIVQYRFLVTIINIFPGKIVWLNSATSTRGTIDRKAQSCQCVNMGTRFYINCYAQEPPMCWALAVSGYYVFHILILRSEDMMKL